MDVYYITGASRGLGRAMAEALLLDPANRVFGIARSRTIRHGNYHHVDLDLGDDTAVSRFRFQPPPRAKRLVLINNAGVIAPVAPVGKLDDLEISRCMKINLISPAILMNKFLSETGTRRADRLIVNISSGAARHTVGSWSGYCSAKAGLDMFSQVLHSEQTSGGTGHPVRVFSIAPGVVDTDMQRELRTVPGRNFADKARFVQMKKNGVLSTAEETAGSILKILRQPENYPDVCMDVRDLQS
ncbi:MAG: SDR family NAD(P)-dependent oxidoreductase [Desulfobacteraceae bacterium]|nr:SDR family NAD(P)-dependent oxidoreductase [Desulfobacteraceae bacterium]